MLLNDICNQAGIVECKEEVDVYSTEIEQGELNIRGRAFSRGGGGGKKKKRQSKQGTFLSREKKGKGRNSPLARGSSHELHGVRQKKD